jgi:hypothetical protein
MKLNIDPSVKSDLVAYQQLIDQGDYPALIQRAIATKHKVLVMLALLVEELDCDLGPELESLRQHALSKANEGRARIEESAFLLLQQLKKALAHNDPQKCYASFNRAMRRYYNSLSDALMESAKSCFAVTARMARIEKLGEEWDAHIEALEEFQRTAIPKDKYELALKQNQELRGVLAGFCNNDEPGEYSTKQLAAAWGIAQPAARARLEKLVERNRIAKPDGHWRFEKDEYDRLIKMYEK